MNNILINECFQKISNSPTDYFNWYQEKEEAFAASKKNPMGAYWEYLLSGFLLFAEQRIALGQRLNTAELKEAAKMPGLLINLLTNTLYRFTAADVIAAGNPKTRFINSTLAHISAKHGVFFSWQEIEQLHDPIDDSSEAGHTLSTLLAARGRHFSLEELLHLPEAADSLGATPAHWMARLGHRFTLAELLALPDKRILTSDFCQNPVVRDAAGNFWTLTAAECYPQKEFIPHPGATVAHIMSREGHVFSDAEIQQLGNPIDFYGKGLRDWQPAAP